MSPSMYPTRNPRSRLISVASVKVSIRECGGCGKRRASRTQRGLRFCLPPRQSWRRRRGTEVFSTNKPTRRCPERGQITKRTHFRAPCVFERTNPLARQSRASGPEHCEGPQRPRQSHKNGRTNPLGVYSKSDEQSHSIGRRSTLLRLYQTNPNAEFHPQMLNDPGNIRGAGGLIDGH